MRDFLLLELEAKTHALKDDPKAVANINRLHKNLRQLIEMELKFSNNPTKLREVNTLWHEFLVRFKPEFNENHGIHSIFTPSTLYTTYIAQTKPTNLLDALLQIQSQLAPGPVLNATQPPPRAIKAPSPVPASAPGDVTSGEKELFSAIEGNKELSVIQRILDKHNAAQLCFKEKKDNILTLAFNKNPSSLSLIVPAVYELPSEARACVLQHCNIRNQSLITPASLINKAFSNAPEAKQALYLLELERIILSMADKEPARERLQLLFNTLKPLDNVITNTDAKKCWIRAIGEARKAPEVTQKTGILNWFRSALGFAQSNYIKGYGVGLFKPSVSTFLNEMTVFPDEKKPAPKN